MSDNKYSGELLREQVFNYRRGELSELDKALFEDGMMDFPEDAQYAGRLMEMLDLAADADGNAYYSEALVFHASGSRVQSPLRGGDTPQRF